MYIHMNGMQAKVANFSDSNAAFSYSDNDEVVLGIND